MCFMLPRAVHIAHITCTSLLKVINEVTSLAIIRSAHMGTNPYQPTKEWCSYFMNPLLCRAAPKKLGGEGVERPVARRRM